MKRLIASLLLSGLLLTGCQGPVEPTPTPSPVTAKEEAVFLAMDTVMTFTVYGPQAKPAIAAAQAEVERLEGLLSVTREDSQVWAVNHSGGSPVTVDRDLLELTQTAQTLGDATSGALDVTLYPVVKAWGFTTGEYQIPAPETLSALLDRVDYSAIGWEQNGDGSGSITLPQGMEMDFGALAKGYTGQICAQTLRDMGVTSAMLNLGGNVQTVGAKPDGSPYRVGIQDPESDTGGYLGIVELVDQAAVTSGGYQRFFEEDGVRYWHIIDPATGAPARSGLTSATIISSSGTLCDGLSTSLFIMGREKALDYWREHRDFETILIGEDRDVWITAGLADAFTLVEDSGCTLHIVEE